uniref:EMI domain-containing protein n=1 Tax=Anopheles stephensi TaxID=30069 RepID=A0A182YMP1_ANOST
MARARKKPWMQQVLSSAIPSFPVALLLMSVYCNSRALASYTELVKDDHLEGPNVCKEVENIPITITTPKEEAYQERYQKWCLGIPPRCSAYRIKIRTVNETRTINKQRIVKKCCVGYQLDEEETHCIPECKAGCGNGTCVNPDVCRCNKGFAGKTCNISCPPNVWGSDCKQPCKCVNGAACNAADGSCECNRGFKGRYCEETCASDRFGQNCAEICQCGNGGKCDNVSGECYCAPGFTGPLCTETCPAGTHGKQCQSKCRCQNGGTCDPVTGECVCPAGYTGTVCANRCQPGWYGLECANRCECFNGADCDRVTGQCLCAPGFMGAKCLDSCPNNQFGINCTETCRCLNEALCDSADGSCTCPDGWTGADCGQRVCPVDRYGANCTGICECKWSNTKMCHPWTGKCQCEPGWSNSACDRPCRFLRYGQDCQLTCNCKNSSPCSHIDGTCLCIAGFKGESCEEPCSNNMYGQNCSERCQCMNGATCEGDSGKCLCAPGWQGIKCDRPCDAQHYGRDCTERCLCQNGGVCNPINGQCTCPAGWTGELCDRKCTPGRFGQNCEQLCDCHLENILACNATTGRCICKREWGGVRCESRCPLGYYGDTCSEICTCHNNSSCDPITGACICARGWTGRTCSEPCPKGFFGHGCMERCPGSAESNRTCNPITGQYTCPPGFIGPTCEHPCSSGYYGQDCARKCDCRNGAECNHITGECQCTPGWTGPRCETVCEDMYYGTNCSQRCSCYNNAKCRKNDGTCVCEAGWMGHRCDEVCPEGFYGNHCMDACECPPGNFLCHAARGCVCMVGWSGKNCDERMAQARIDEGKRLLWEEKGLQFFLPVKQLREVFYSPYLTPFVTYFPGELRLVEEAIVPPPKRYDIRIERVNNSATHRHDREPHQPIATNDKRDRQQEASAVYNVSIAFSLYANSLLASYNRTHSIRPGQQIAILHRADGFADLTLVQMHSYVTLLEQTGESGSISGSSNFMETFINSTSYRVAVEEDLTVNVSRGSMSRGSSGSVLAVVLTILFVCIFAAMLLYYRRRVANLKAEVNHVVNYMTQEQPSHFDNPVYARTGGANGGVAIGTLSSNGTIVPPLDARTGLLRNVLPNNLRDVMSGRRRPKQDKYSYPDNEYGVDKSYSISHYGPESLKNFEADMTNPNCFKDHVYDEIRLKDSIDTEYDHLDYSRPGSSHKAHYFRMTDGTTNGTVPGAPLPNGTLASTAMMAGPSGGGSPKAINVLRDTSGGSSSSGGGGGGPINNLSAPPRINNLLPAVPSSVGTEPKKCSNTDPPSNLGNDLSSSSNSSPTPPSSPSPSPHSQRLVPASGDDLYVPMTAGGDPGSATASTSSGSEYGGLNIPNHQLNIKE